MSNCVFVETGQCGNQLGFALFDTLYGHLGGGSGESAADYEELETYFRLPLSKQHKPVARAVCLDTEPKVVQESLAKGQRHPWRIDRKSVAYRHGGAGNNWALGYEMASGEFLETAINLVARELEHCDYTQTLVFTHSLAGGTGSGLGTRMSEACADVFPQATRLNIAIAPYHFGEVVVQHYNAVLCLAKTSAASEAVLTFENEVAKTLCKTMKGIERPTLDQLNETIVSNLCPIFLPKRSAAEGKLFTLRDDISHLCSHAGYKFLDVKLTPQTSNKSVAFTYDSWSTLLKTIQQLQMSGTASERNIKSYLKHALTTDPTLYGYRAPRSDGMASPASPTALQNVARSVSHSTGLDGRSASSGGPYASPPTKGIAPGQAHRVTPPPASGRGVVSSIASSTATGSTAAMDSGVVRSLATVLTLHGAEAADKARVLHDAFVSSSSSTISGGHEYHASNVGSGVKGTPTSSTTRTSLGRSPSDTFKSHPPQAPPELQLHEMYQQSHSNLLPYCNMDPVRFCSSAPRLNGYERATSVLSNNQAVLPLLQRAVRGGSELFQEGAYLHQYATYGIEEADFQQVFLSLGCSVQNYIDL